MTEQVGPYRVLEAIGAGGSARVDLAALQRAYGFERQVVLKRPLEHLRDDAEVARSLVREAALGGRLVHPNLVAVLDAGTHDGYPYLALEYVDGPSLRELMHEAQGMVRRLPLAAALSIVVAVARGLHVAHELAGDDGDRLGLVHRDVSPANVLVGKDGAVKLADFGIAKDTRVSTLSGSMRGTVTYMAPEQCRGHAFDRRADLFSLGVILHELLTGRRLFWADNDVASLHRVLSGEVPDPRQIDPSIAPELAELTMQALAYDPQQRVATASELADRLEAFALGAGILVGTREIARAVAVPAVARPQPAPAVPDEPSLIPAIEGVTEPALVTSAPARRSRRWLAAAIGVGLAGGAVVAWQLAQRPGDAAAQPAMAPVAPAPAAPPPSVEEAAIAAPPEPEPEPPPAPRPKKPVVTKRTKRRARPAVTRKKPPVAPSPSPTVEWNKGMLLPTDPGKTHR